MKKKYASKYNTPEYRKRYTGLYGTWYSMKQRCKNPNHMSYKDYGARGITYPAKWESFEGFKTDMEGGYEKGLFIDRIDNNKSYSKENCRWVTRKLQNNNKRSNIVLTFRGSTLPLAIWAQKLGMDFDTLRSRWYRGWSREKILATRKFKPYQAMRLYGE